MQSAKNAMRIMGIKKVMAGVIAFIMLFTTLIPTNAFAEGSNDGETEEKEVEQVEQVVEAQEQEEEAPIEESIKESEEKKAEEAKAEKEAEAEEDAEEAEEEAEELEGIYHITDDADFYVHFIDAARIKEASKGFGLDHSGEPAFMEMPLIAREDGKSDDYKLVSIDFENGTYVVEPKELPEGVTDRKEAREEHSIVYPFGFEYDRTVGVLGGKDNQKKEFTDRIALDAVGNVAVVANTGNKRTSWDYMLESRKDWDSMGPVDNSGNYIDYAALYKRLSAEELPIKVVKSGTTDEITTPSALYGEDNFKVSEKDGSDVSSFNILLDDSEEAGTFASGERTVNRKNTSVKGAEYTFDSAYIVREVEKEDGKTEEKKIAIKGLRYDKGRNLWFYSKDGSFDTEKGKDLEALGSNDSVYIEYESAEDAKAEEAKKAGTFKAEIEGYDVVVEADDKAFDKEVKLQVKEVLLPGEKVKDVANDKENTQKMSDETVEILKDSNLYDKEYNAVDITFVDENGEKVEPQTEVKVRLTVDKAVLKKEIDEKSIRLDHVVEDTKGDPKETENIVLGDMKNENGNTVEYKEKSNKFVFDFVTDNFSVYQIGGNPINVNFVTAVYKNGELYGYDGSLTDQMPKWKGSSSYGAIRFVDDSNKDACYVDNEGVEHNIAIDKSRYTWKIAYIVPRVTSQDDWTEGKFGEYIKNNGVEISEIRYLESANKWQYYDRKVGSGNAGWKDIPNDRSYEIYSIYEDKQRTATPANQVPTVDSSSKGLHMYMIDYTGGHNGDWGDSKGLYYISSEYTSSGKRGQTIQDLYSHTVNDDGYPTLTSTSMKIYGQGAVTDDQRNLKNWFDPDAAQNNELVSSIQKANHLFRLSDYENNGYFFYDSALNAAYMEKDKAKNPNGDFKVYDNIVTAARNNNYADIFFYQRGMFTPYNNFNSWQNEGWKSITNDYDASGKAWADYTNADYANMYNGEEYKEKVGDKVYYADGARLGANYHFGMYLYCDFFQPVNGQVSHKGNEPEDMVYEFTGDDDMLVYIDGVLVLDLGGIHDAESGKINFRTGTVEYTMNYNNGNTNPVYVTKTTTIKEMFEKAGKTADAQWDGSTFDAGTSHRIQIFYMERGAAASNLKIKLNIPPVPDGAVALTKAVEKEEGQVALNGTTSGSPKEYFLMKVQIKKPGGQWEDIPAGTEYSVAGNTWSIRKDGYLLLLDRETAIFNFSGDEYTNGNEKTKIRVTEVSSSKLSKEEIEAELFSSIGADKAASKIYDIKYWETKAKTGSVVENSNSTEITERMAGEGSEIDPAKINMITVQNKPSSLKIKKEIENPIDGDEDREFSFDVTLSDVSLSETKFQALTTRANGSKAISWVDFVKEGNTYKAVVKLKKDETMQIFNLPKTATYRVNEAAATGFITEYDNGGESAVVDNNGVSGSLSSSGEPVNAAVTVNNRRPAAIKIDAGNGEAVAGGQFSVYELKNVDGIYYRMKLYASNLTADSEGKIVLPVDKVPTNQDLFIFETEAPAGYEKAKAPWVMWISPKGRPTLFTHKTPYGTAYSASDWDGRRGVGTGAYYGKPYWHTNDFTKVDGTAELKNRRLPVELEKVDGRDETKPLEGAEFEVYKAYEEVYGDGKLRKGDFVGKTSPSDSEGKFSFPTSENGYYLMFETKAPDGYYPAKAPWYVVISSGTGGTPVVQLWQYPDLMAEGPFWKLKGTDGYQCKTYTKVINYQYEALTKVNHVSGSGKKTLAGAEFDLYMVEEGSELYSVANGENNGGTKLNSEPIVSDSNGKVKLPIPEPGKKYLLFETKAPEGYQRAKSPWLVKANADGTLTLYQSTAPDKVVDNSGNDRSADNSVVTFNRWWRKSWFDNNAVGSKELVNEPKPIELEKWNEDESLTLPGAAFKVCRINDGPNMVDYFVEGTRTKQDGASAKEDEKLTVSDKALKGVNSEDPESKTVTSDQNGKININGLGAGKYFLFETKAPEGYQRAKSPWMIIVTEDESSYSWQVKAIDPKYYGKYKVDSAIYDWDGKTLTDTWWNKRGKIGSQQGTDWYMNQPDTTKLINEPLYELPSAGGIGVYPFTFIGTIMAMIALVLIFANKKEEVR